MGPLPHFLSHLCSYGECVSTAGVRLTVVQLVWTTYTPVSILSPGSANKSNKFLGFPKIDVGRMVFWFVTGALYGRGWKLGGGTMFMSL